MQKTEIGFCENHMMLCIDSFQNGEMRGSVTHPALQQALSFASVAELLLAVETLLEQAGFPTAFTRPRSFAQAGARPAAGAPCCGSGRLATFLLQVRYRQNTCWQGRLTWLEQNKTRTFRSDLDLVSLLSAALE